MHRIKPSVHDFLFYFCCPYLIFLYKVDICLSFCLYQYHISCMVHWTHWTHWTHWPFCLKCWMEKIRGNVFCSVKKKSWARLTSRLTCTGFTSLYTEYTTHEQVDLYKGSQACILNTRLTSRLTFTGLTSLYTEYTTHEQVDLCTGFTSLYTEYSL